MPLWVCIGLVLAMLVAASEATASVRSNADGVPIAARSGSALVAGAAFDGSSTELSRLRGDVCESIAVVSDPGDEDEDSFETLRAACALAPVPPSDVFARPVSSVLTVDTGRPTISTGLGRGPP